MPVKRTMAVLLGALMLSAPILSSEMGAGASTVKPDVVAGTYDMHLNWYNRGWVDAGPIMLHANHTGTDPGLDTIIWSRSSRTITLVFTTSSNPDIEATYIGTLNLVGISRKHKPGTMTNNMGGSGTWYAVKVG